jgi:short-subunit dehydrogenase
MPLDLNGRVVVITGASRGIGVHIARDLATTGARLVLAARDPGGLDALATELRATGATVDVVPTDVTSAADRRRLVDAAGPVDVLVNNAGIEYTVSLLDHTEEEVEREIAVDLVAPILLTRAVLPGMIERRRGTIVMISSMSGKSPIPWNAVYAGAKYGMNGFTASLRIELSGTGVHCGVVCPGFVADAGMWSEFGLSAPRFFRAVPAAKVAAGVRRVVEGAPEVLVTAGPVRPMLALAQIFPRLDEPVLRALGVLDVLKERARVAASRR